MPLQIPVSPLSATFTTLLSLSQRFQSLWFNVKV